MIKWLLLVISRQILFIHQTQPDKNFCWNISLQHFYITCSRNDFAWVYLYVLFLFKGKYRELVMSQFTDPTSPSLNESHNHITTFMKSIINLPCSPWEVLPQPSSPPHIHMLHMYSTCRIHWSTTNTSVDREYNVSQNHCQKQYGFCLLYICQDHFFLNLFQLLSGKCVYEKLVIDIKSNSFCYMAFRISAHTLLWCWDSYYCVKYPNDWYTSKRSYCSWYFNPSNWIPNPGWGNK